MKIDRNHCHDLLFEILFDKIPIFTFLIVSFLNEFRAVVSSTSLHTAYLGRDTFYF